MTDISHTPRRSSRTRRKGLYTLLTVIFALLYLVAVAADALIAANIFWLSAAFALAMTVAGFGWARTLDELQIKNHYEAWFWGGSIGLTVSALLFLALMPSVMSFDIAALPMEDANDIVAMSFVGGFILAMLPATIGYLVWWGVLWMRNR
jgi:opacity protein-like surface antigen